MEIFNLEQTSTGYYRSVKIEVILVQVKVRETLVWTDTTALLYFTAFIFILFIFNKLFII